MNTEKYHSLAAYDIYLTVPGCESPLALKRCSEAVEGQLCTGSRALTPLAPTSCGSEIQTQLSLPQGPELGPAPPRCPRRNASTRLYLLCFIGKELNA